MATTYLKHTRHYKICDTCGTQFWTNLSDGRFCNRKCQDKHFNKKAQRLSLKLTDDQREVILALQDYFIRDWKFERGK